MELKVIDGIRRFCFHDKSPGTSIRDIMASPQCLYRLPALFNYQESIHLPTHASTQVIHKVINYL